MLLKHSKRYGLMEKFHFTRLPSWASDLIKTDESIIAGIESAGKKYDGSPQLVAKDANRGEPIPPKQEL